MLTVTGVQTCALPIFGIGGQAAKQGYKVALKEALKGKISKEISEQAIKDRKSVV